MLDQSPFSLHVCGKELCRPEAVRELSAMFYSVPTALVPIPVGKDYLHPSDLQSLCPDLVVGKLRVTQSAKPWVRNEEKAQGLL